MLDETEAPEEGVILSDTPMDGEEKKHALELVADMQSDRANDRLNLSEVPHILLSYQKKWHADKSQIRIAKKSRRIGFSWGSLASEAVLEAAEIGGMNQFYMGYNQAMAAEFIGDCTFFAKAFGHAIRSIDVWKTTVLIANEKRDIVTYKIMIGSHRIEALSSNPHNWRGKQGHARVDEAAFHTNLREVIKGALAFLMWGGRLSIISSLNGEDNPFNELLEDVKKGKLPWSMHSIDFDQALEQGFYKRVCLVTKKPWSLEAEQKYRADTFAGYPNIEDANEELLCIPKRGSGAYFSRMLIESCAEKDVPVIRYAKPAKFVLDPKRSDITRKWCIDVLKPIIDAMPTDKRTALGQDFGRSGDLSDIWVLQEESPTLWRTPFLLELRNIPFDIQQQILFFILDLLPLFHHAKFDARGNGQSHAEAALQKYGANRIECVMATTAWYATWFPKYRQAYEDRSIRVPASEDVTADHRSVILVKGSPTMSDARTNGTDGMPRHGDSAIAGLLAYAASREEALPSAGATVPADPSIYSSKSQASGDGLAQRLHSAIGQSLWGKR